MFLPLDMMYIHDLVCTSMKKKTSKTARFNFRLTAELLKDFKRAAAKLRVSESELVRRGIEWAVAQASNGKKNQ